MHELTVRIVHDGNPLSARSILAILRLWDEDRNWFVQTVYDDKPDDEAEAAEALKNANDMGMYLPSQCKPGVVFKLTNPDDGLAGGLEPLERKG